MEDKLIMTNILDTSKSLCNLFNQGSIEANDTSFNTLFKKVLSNLHTMQHEIYKSMQDEGWYPTEDVKSPAVNKVKTKFCTESKTCSRQTKDN